MNPWYCDNTIDLFGKYIYSPHKKGNHCFINSAGQNILEECLERTWHGTGSESWPIALVSILVLGPLVASHHSPIPMYCMQGTLTSCFVMRAGGVWYNRGKGDGYISCHSSAINHCTVCVCTKGCQTPRPPTSLHSHVIWLMTRVLTFQLHSLQYIGCSSRYELLAFARCFCYSCS